MSQAISFTTKSFQEFFIARVVPAAENGQTEFEAEAVCRHCLQILTAVVIKLVNLAQLLLIIDQYISPWKAERCMPG